MIHLAILGSTRGTALETFIAEMQKKKLAAGIKLILSNKADAYILTRAQQHQIPHAFVNPQGLTREDYDAQIAQLLKKARIDLIVLIGYMRILSTQFVAEWQNKIINVHPSLLPAFAGGMDLDVHQAVLTAGVPETGCTVHYVTEEVDAGPVLIQKRCPVLTGDTPEQLKLRVQALEGVALAEAVQKILN